MSKWLPSLSIVALGGALGVTWVGPLNSAADQAIQSQATALARLAREISEVQTELAGSQVALENMEKVSEDRELLRGELSVLAAELESTRTTLEAQTLELAEVEKRQGLWVRQTLGERIADLNQDLEARWNDVSTTLEATVQIAENNRTSFDHLLQSVDQSEADSRDIQLMWDDLMGPTVQISDDSTVGSGVMLESVKLGPDHYRTYLLTAWHVVRDIVDDATDEDELVQVYVYDQSGSRRMEWATLAAYDERLDSALMVMRSRSKFSHGAKLPTRETLEELDVFATIYAVGCPLGNDPIPTFGEIADTHHEVEGDAYWMINAPTYIGNSGGGIFASQTHELLGIFSKIYTHGNLRPTVIPHMGLVTPLQSVYDWLEESGYAHVVPK